MKISWQISNTFKSSPRKSYPHDSFLVVWIQDDPQCDTTDTGKLVLNMFSMEDTGGSHKLGRENVIQRFYHLQTKS